MKKVVFKLKFYTDGDWSYNIDDFKNDHSRYFEDDLYEYTSVDYSSMSMRRVYDMFEIDKLISMLYKIKGNLHSRNEHNYKVITDFMDEIIENVLAIKEDQNLDHIWNEICVENWDGTEYSIDVIDTDAKKIKQIIYEGE